MGRVEGKWYALKKGRGMMIKKFIAHPHTALIGRILLGTIFIYAGLSKILNPEQFALAVMNYRIVPLVSVNLCAIVLPWLELLSGIFLLVGLFSEGSIVMITLLMALFLGAIGSALLRGLDINCGCFSTEGVYKITILYFIRDLLLFALTLQVLFYDRGFLSVDKLLKRRG
jgi:putative oxidoreductase